MNDGAQRIVQRQALKKGEDTGAVIRKGKLTGKCFASLLPAKCHPKDFAYYTGYSPLPPRSVL